LGVEGVRTTQRGGRRDSNQESTLKKLRERPIPKFFGEISDLPRKKKSKGGKSFRKKLTRRKKKGNNLRKNS